MVEAIGYRLEFEIPAPLPELPQKRWHWSKVNRAVANWRDVVILYVPRGRRPAEPLRRARITLTRRSSVEPDYDNLVSGFKPLVDALTLSKNNNKGRMVWRADVLVDDRPSVLLREYWWEKAAPRHGSIHVVVEAIPRQYVVSCEMDPQQITDSLKNPGAIIRMPDPEPVSFQAAIRKLCRVQGELEAAQNALALQLLRRGRERRASESKGESSC